MDYNFSNVNKYADVNYIPTESPSSLGDILDYETSDKSNLREITDHIHRGLGHNNNIYSESYADIFQTDNSIEIIISSLSYSDYEKSYHFYKFGIEYGNVKIKVFFNDSVFKNKPKD